MPVLTCIFDFYVLSTSHVQVCNKPCLDDGVSQIIEYAGHKFHDDCFTCSECDKNMHGVASSTKARFIENGQHSLLLCGLACRDAELLRRARFASTSEKRADGDHDASPTVGVSCANCMHGLQDESDSTVQVLLACNKYWHEAHFDCTSCGIALGGRGSRSKYYEYSDWPYCSKCYVKDFSTCSRCDTVIGSNEEAVNALGRTFHSACFGCDVCQTHFAQGTYMWLLGMWLFGCCSFCFVVVVGSERYVRYAT
jgi:hypothetical protein